MRTTAALVLSLATLSGACFPTNPKARTIAKLAEGGAIVAGIALLAVVNTGADCASDIPGMPDTSCQDSAGLAGGIGLGLILGGLVGFIATVSTSPEDKPDQPVNTLTPTPIAPAPAPAPVTPPPAPAPAPVPEAPPAPEPTPAPEAPAPTPAP